MQAPHPRGVVAIGSLLDRVGADQPTICGVILFQALDYTFFIPKDIVKKAIAADTGGNRWDFHNALEFMPKSLGKNPAEESTRRVQ
jgi:hypothetical protein